MGLSTLISGIVNVVKGDGIKSATDFINTRWPPDMSEEQKAQIELQLKEFDAKQKELEHNRELAMLEKAHEADSEFNQRIKDMEGTASDLKTIPIIGSLIIFLRGVQRPLWGYCTLIMDFMVFSGKWTIVLTTASGITPLGFILIIINFLVLGFLFGERAIKNVTPVLMPLIESVWGRKG